MKLSITHALFDFDGTISLVREGWQPIMLDMMVRILERTPRHESRPELEDMAREFIAELTGKQTIYQMMRLKDEVDKRGGVSEDPVLYKKEYIALIEDHIADRLAQLERGAVLPEAYLVPGAYAFLQRMTDLGIVMSLASGTDDEFVRREARLLRVDHFFKTIGGAQENYREFSKRIAIERALHEGNISGDALAVFGDGYVEIEEAKKHGALAIGVASNEATREGTDEWKRARLARAGADLIVGDFRDQASILSFLSLRASS